LWDAEATTTRLALAARAAKPARQPAASPVAATLVKVAATLLVPITKKAALQVLPRPRAALVAFRPKAALVATWLRAALAASLPPRLALAAHERPPFFGLVRTR